MTLAPSVRILSLLVLASGLASGHPRVLAVGGVILLVTGGVALVHHLDFELAGLLRMLRRVRWLLLAMMILYGWYTPGDPLVPMLGSWSPSIAGVQQGLLRVAALLSIVVAVYLLLMTTPRGDLVGGLLWFGRPLRRLGVDDRRFAVRLVLALEAVPQVQGLARKALETDTSVSRIQRLGQAASRVLQAVLEQADAQHGTIEVPDAQPVPGWQWLVPLLMVVLLVAVTRV